MESTWLSLLPPIVAIVMAFVTRKIIVSLLVGIFVGTWITSDSINIALRKMWNIIYDKTEFYRLLSWQQFNEGWYIYIILFCCILGIIINLLRQAGGAQAYGQWAIENIKSRTGAKLSTMLMGIVIFFDDYFSCLTVGAVMRPATDKFKISRAKLAYIIDSTTAPICILVPISSWVVEVVNQLRNAGVGQFYQHQAFFSNWTVAATVQMRNIAFQEKITQTPLSIFLESIAFNSYAWLALAFVAYICIRQRDFGPMKQHEDTALATGNVFNGENSTTDVDLEQVASGKIQDLIIPIVFLIASIITLLSHTGHIGKSMFWGGLLTLVLLIWYLRFFRDSLLSLSQIYQTIISSLKTMIPIVITLILAWSLSTVIYQEVKTGNYLASFVSASDSQFLRGFLPAIIFAISCIVSFATGTSWGTFAIMIPIVVPLSHQTTPHLFVPCIAAVLAGAIYGDHTSPISDTTILSSIGAGCRHIDHVVTQAPYSAVIACASCVGFIINGFTIHWGHTVSATMSLICGALLVWAMATLAEKFSNSPSEVRVNEV